MQRSFVEIAHACASNAPVLLAGPTGTGKTHTAKIIHPQSTRRDSPFIVLHCGALPKALLETELFGHEKGAFTGAACTGHLERAHGGTLFLDEIADFSPAIQAKLLRFAEERTFTRLGGREDLRLITATHRDLREEVRAGRFRDDLYYRLHVLEIALPALRERPGDLPALAAFFLGTLAADRHLTLAPETLAILQAHDWPGNVRELRNALEHAVAVSHSPLILPPHLPRTLHAAPASPGALEPALAAWLQARLASGVSYREPRSPFLRQDRVNRIKKNRKKSKKRPFCRENFPMAEPGPAGAVAERVAPLRSRLSEDKTLSGLVSFSPGDPG